MISFTSVCLSACSLLLEHININFKKKNKKNFLVNTQLIA